MHNQCNCSNTCVSYSSWPLFTRARDLRLQYDESKKTVAHGLVGPISSLAEVIFGKVHTREWSTMNRVLIHYELNRVPMAQANDGNASLSLGNINANESFNST